jgi:AcrR family transcriptional regulator
MSTLAETKLFGLYLLRESAMKIDVGGIKKGRKFDQVLDGAREVFMRDGFEGASVDDIARAAGVSKATLYSYFPDKRLLFLEVAKSECTRQATAAAGRMEMQGSLSEALRGAASELVRFFLSDFGVQMYRMCVAETERFPEIGQQFYESGPMVARRILTSVFAEAVRRGEARIDDLDTASDQFCELCKSGLHPRLVMGVQTSFSDAEIDHVVNGAVEMFMARYGV